MTTADTSATTTAATAVTEAAETPPPAPEVPCSAEYARWLTASRAFERLYTETAATLPTDKRAHRAALRALRDAAYAMSHAHAAYSTARVRETAGQLAGIPLGRLLARVSEWESRYYRRTGKGQEDARRRLVVARMYVRAALERLEGGATKRPR